MKKTFGYVGVTLMLAGCAGGGGYDGNPLNSAAVRIVGGAAAGALLAGALDGSGTKGAMLGALAGGASCVNGGCY